MGFLSNLRALFIPNKAQHPGQPGYGTDMRAIETWAAELIKAIETIPGGGGGGGYASLTGPGQTVTPGALTQAGAFTISNGTLTQGGGNVSLGNGWITTTTGGGGTATMGYSVGHVSVLGSGLIEVWTQGPGQLIHIFTTGSGGAGSTSGDILIDASAGTVTIIANPSIPYTKLAFFGATGSTRIAGSTITTLAQLVSALQSYGLLG